VTVKLYGRAEEKLRALRERLGEKACNLVQLNSREEGSGRSAYEGLFQAQMQLEVPGGGGGEPASHAPPPSQVRGLCNAFAGEEERHGLTWANMFATSVMSLDEKIILLCKDDPCVAYTFCVPSDASSSVAWCKFHHQKLSAQFPSRPHASSLSPWSRRTYHVTSKAGMATSRSRVAAHRVDVILCEVEIVGLRVCACINAGAGSAADRGKREERLCLSGGVQHQVLAAQPGGACQAATPSGDFALFLPVYLFLMVKVPAAKPDLKTAWSVCHVTR